MNVLYSILTVYFSVSLLVALILAGHIFFTFDRFDRKYRSMGFSVILNIFLWPILLLKPKFMLDPSELLSDGSVQAEEARLRECPPPSGDRVRYCQSQGRYEKSYGVFVFDSSDVEEVLQEQLSENSHLYNRAISFGTNFLCLANYSAHKSTKISLISCTSQKFSF